MARLASHTPCTGNAINGSVNVVYPCMRQALFLSATVISSCQVVHPNSDAWQPTNLPSICSLLKLLEHLVRHAPWFLVDLIALERVRSGPALRGHSERRLERVHVVWFDSGIVEVSVDERSFSSCIHVPSVQRGLCPTRRVPAGVRSPSFSQEAPVPSVDFSDNCAAEQCLRNVLFAK